MINHIPSPLDVFMAFPFEDDRDGGDYRTLIAFLAFAHPNVLDHWRADRRLVPIH